MVLPSHVQKDIGHPDLDKAWCKDIISNADIDWGSSRGEEDTTSPGNPSNSMFDYTLTSDRGIRARLQFRRPSREPESINGMEACFLLSIGDGVDGKTGRAHGGFNGVILDHISGYIASYSSPNPMAPATATMTVDYKAPVETPCIILARAWLIELSGRKVWVKAVLEDESGKTLAAAKSLFISAKPVEPAKL